MPDRLTKEQMMERAAKGLGKIDHFGARGITLVTMDELEAMAALLACLGLKPIYPPQGE